MTRRQVLTCIIDLCKALHSMGLLLLGLEVSHRHELHFINNELSMLQGPRLHLNKKGESLVNAPTRGQVLTCIIDLCKVWACICLALKTLFVTSFISVMASYLRCKNKDCISASRANLVNAPTRGQVLTCIIDLCKVWACFCLDLKCLSRQRASFHQ